MVEYALSAYLGPDTVSLNIKNNNSTTKIVPQGKEGSGVGGGKSLCSHLVSHECA